jgi:hypothetical protein
MDRKPNILCERHHIHFVNLNAYAVIELLSCLDFVFFASGGKPSDIHGERFMIGWIEVEFCEIQTKTQLSKFARF